jgi:RNA polymerase sigma-70 factor, ECF subfamily
MHQELAYRVAYLIAGEDAEDAVQDAALKAWRSLGRFRPAAPFRPWLLRIVANEARNRRRSAGRRAALALRARREDVSGDAAPSPEAAVLAADERVRLAAALERLPDDARLALGCRYLLDLSEAETAAALGVRRGTVKSRVSRALERLREAYG